jgi:hypothetical protein
MCAEKIHRLLIAMILGLNMGLVGIGALKLAFLIQLVLMIGFIVWGTTGICVSLAIIRQIATPCDEEEKKED